LVSLTLLAGCDAAAGGGDLVRSLPAWTLGDEEVRIGALDDPDFAYGPVREVALDALGRPYSSHPQEARIRRWTRDGRPDGFIGREGSGPGEFSEIRAMGFFGDSLWAMDGRAHRVSFFDERGTFLGSVTPRVDLGGAASRNDPPPRPILPLRSGGFYGQAPAWSDAIALGELTRSLHVRMDADGGGGDTVYWRPHRPEDLLALLAPDGAGGTFGQQPFPDGVLVSVEPARERVAVVERPAWTGTGPSEYRVTALDMTGDTLWGRSFPYAAQPLEPAVVDDWVRDRAVSMHRFMSRMREGLTVHAVERDIAAAVYRPAYRPPVTAVVWGSDGTLWLALPPPSLPGVVPWLVLDARGEPLATVEVPSELRLLSASRTEIWGVFLDEFDVHYLVRHPLRRGQDGTE
jgi:hypothetical protein